MSKFDISLYNEEFFEWHLKYAREYSIKTMDWFIEKYKPQSVIDFGCGIGSYLESAHNHGLPFWGFDISPSAKKYTPDHIQLYIFYADCATDMDFHFHADCVISFETAEHIDPDGTDQFIQNLVNATGKWLLFTAAPPGQEGCGHINCHPKAFWVDKFLDHKLIWAAKMETDISDNWRRLGAPNYICDNLIVFKR
jgi:cyclopropane fatty-acyl-phospholipid synthase-like methyltransferase